MRIQQRGYDDTKYLVPNFAVTRGSAVTANGTLTIKSIGGIYLVAGRWVLPTNPGTGTWNFTMSSLSGLVSDQIFGQIGVIGTGTGAVPARISATGVVTPVGTLPEPGTNGIVTITGMVV
jgi:hypothetical protein